jgi:hypothetical protein
MSVANPTGEPMDGASNLSGCAKFIIKNNDFVALSGWRLSVL